MATASTTGTRDPRVIVCAGGGGVGKTTTSAALSLALARQGFRTLIVTIDPARRLAGAMGTPITDEVTRVALPAAHGRLSALMPDPRRSLRTFVEHLFEGEPEAKARILANGVYKGLADAAAGVHELVAMNLVAHAASGGAFDVVVIDTAPSRHAVDFVTYPERLAALLGGRAVGWLGTLAQKATDGVAASKSSGGLLSWGTSQAESLVTKVTGPTMARDTAALFADLAIVRDRFVSLTKHAASLLLGEGASYVLVSAPTAAARDDVLYLAKRLEKLGRAPRAVVMNRADTQPDPFVRTLRAAPGISPAILEAVDVLERERSSRSTAADALSREFAKRMPKAPQVRLPHVEAAAPETVVVALSQALDAHVTTLLPPGR